jgi:hypothetical protein
MMPVIMAQDGIMMEIMFSIVKLLRRQLIWMLIMLDVV